MTTSEMKSEIIRLVDELAKEGIKTTVEASVHIEIDHYSSVCTLNYKITFTEETAV